MAVRIFKSSKSKLVRGLMHNQAVNGTAFPRRLWLCSKAARYLRRYAAWRD